MGKVLPQLNTLTRHTIHGEAEALVQQVAYEHRPVLLQTGEGVQAMLVPFDTEQACFWAPEWQAAERQVDQQLSAGDYQDFDTMEDFIASRKESPDPTA